MDSALKPCPFCGAGAHFESDADGRVWVECESCGMASNRSASLMDDFIPPLTEAWNRRALPAPAAGDPELPEPDMEDDYGNDGHSSGQLRAYGQAMAEHARRAAMEEAVQAAADVDEPAWHGYECPNTFQDGVSAAIAAIRAAAPPQGEQT